jgi:hypothetical protein
MPGPSDVLRPLSKEDCLTLFTATGVPPLGPLWESGSGLPILDGRACLTKWMWKAMTTPSSTRTIDASPFPASSSVLLPSSLRLRCPGGSTPKESFGALPPPAGSPPALPREKNASLLVATRGFVAGSTWRPPGSRPFFAFLLWLFDLFEWFSLLLPLWPLLCGAGFHASQPPPVLGQGWCPFGLVIGILLNLGEVFRSARWVGLYRPARYSSC